MTVEERLEAIERRLEALEKRTLPLVQYGDGQREEAALHRFASGPEFIRAMEERFEREQP